MRRTQSKEERADRWKNWESTRNTILLRSHSDLFEGVRPDATDMQRGYYLHLVAESKRLVSAGSAVMLHNSRAGLDSHIAGWAAHFMPIAEFEDFYVESVFLNKLYAPEAMIWAWRSVEHFRDFPRLVARQTDCLSGTYLGGIEDETSRETGLNQIRETILAHVKQDLQKGAEAFERFKIGEIGKYVDFAHRCFFEFVREETLRSNEDIKDEALRARYIQEVEVQGWAAHFCGSGKALDFDDYKKFYVRTIIANRRNEVLAARRALKAAQRMAGFPPLQGSFDVCAKLTNL